MQVGGLAEDRDRHAVAAQVAQVALVHRAVHVAHQMDQHPQGVELLRFGQSAGLQPHDERIDGPQHVAIRVGRHRIERLARIDVHIVPALGMGIGGRMAGIVHPVGVIDR